MTDLDNDYSGARAIMYDVKRQYQKLWHKENNAVKTLLKSAKVQETVCDIPVGTGRFFKIYHDKKLNVTGYDLSKDMLQCAKKKQYSNIVRLKEGDIFDDKITQMVFDWTICIRLLNRFNTDNMKRAVRALANRTAQKCILGIMHNDNQENKRKGQTIVHPLHEVESIFNEVGFVVANRIKMNNEGYYIYLLYKCRPWTSCWPHCFKATFREQNKSRGIHIVSHSTAGKSTFIKQHNSEFNNILLFDMDDLVATGVWHGRGKTLNRIVAEHPYKLCCLLSNAHTKPEYIDTNFVAVIPSFDEMLRNQAARQEWAKTKKKKPKSSELQNVLAWRESLIQWVQTANISIAPSFEAVLE